MKHSLLTILILLGIAVAAGQVRAQDAVLPAPATGAANTADLLPHTDDQRTTYANAYYERCVALGDPNVSEAAWHDTCMCHSVHMLRHLRTEELEVMATGRGRYNVNKERLFPQVYAPCFEFVLDETLLEDCYDASFIRQMVRTQNEYEGICECVREGALQFVREAAEPLMAAIVQQTPWVEDALTAFTNSFQYRREHGIIRRACTNKFLR